MHNMERLGKNAAPVNIIVEKCQSCNQAEFCETRTHSKALFCFRQACASHKNMFEHLVQI